MRQHERRVGVGVGQAPIEGVGRAKPPLGRSAASRVEEASAEEAPSGGRPGSRSPWTSARGLRSLGACALVGAGLSLPVPSHAISDKECQRPRPPEVPEASKASDVDMIAARQRIKMYLDASSIYLECLVEAEETMGTTAREVKQSRIDRKREEIQTEMQTVADTFNEQVRAYKARTEPEAEAAPPSPEPSEADEGASPAPDGASDGTPPSS